MAEKLNSGLTCAAPGCGKPLYAGNRSGVCNPHKHLKGACRCRDCRGEGVSRKRARPICAVPGCGLALSKKNASGVCVTHAHAPGLCRCPKCTATGVRRAEAKARAGVRSVSVASHIAVSSGGVPQMRVSLPCEPWLRGEA